MTDSIKMKFTVVILLWCMAMITAFAQEPILVTGRPFVVSSAFRDSYKGLDARLPEMISNGILYPSGLKYRAMAPEEAAAFRNVSGQSIQRDTLLLSLTKDLQRAGVRFFIEGEVVIRNEQFYLTMFATDFKSPLVPYRSELHSMAQFQNVIDEACANLNYQIDLRLRGGTPRTVQVERFTYPKRVQSQRRYLQLADLLKLDFPVRYISLNLKNTKQYVVLPYRMTYSQQTAPFDSLLHSKEPDLTVFGKIDIAGTDSCLLEPAIRSMTDTAYLPPIKFPWSKTDDAHSQLLTSIQALLNVIAEVGSLKELKNYNSEADYNEQIEKALRAHNSSLAKYYAHQLSLLRRREQKNDAKIIQGKVLVNEGNYLEARRLIEEYLATDSINDEANYYGGITNSRLGRYEKAKDLFSRIKHTRNFKDISFQLGVCLLSQDSTTQALRYFLLQDSLNNSVNPELYSYLGLTYQKLNRYDEAEKYYRLQSINDKDGQKELRRFYTESAMNRFSSRAYIDAYNYHMKAYGLSKSYGSLRGAIDCLMKLKEPESRVRSIVDTGIRDSVFQRNSIYLVLSLDFLTEVDSSHHYVPNYMRCALDFLRRHVQLTNDKEDTYLYFGYGHFSLQALDSAEYYYALSRKAKPYDVMSHLNLAEVQIMKHSVDKALTTLAGVKKLLDKSKMNNDHYLTLLYFYTIECKILKGSSYKEEASQLDRLLAMYSGNNTTLILDWDFVGFYNWVFTSEKLRASPKMQKQLARNLCKVLPYSINFDLPCNESIY